MYLVFADGGILNPTTGKCVGRVDHDGLLRAFVGSMQLLDTLLKMQPLRVGMTIDASVRVAQPLTDAELAKIWDEALDHFDLRDQLRVIARAIERAHGIGQEGAA